MRFFISIYILLILLPLSGIAQNFGCYETPVNSGGANVLDGAYSSTEKSTFDNFKITNAKDGYYKEYYVTRQWYPTQLKMEGKIVNGKQQGKWILYIKDRTRFYSGNYIDGLKEDEWKGSYVNDKGDTIIFWIGSFMHDKLNGLVKNGLYKSGKIEEELNYTNGLKNGRGTKYFEDGRVEEITNYQNGKKYGQYMEYDESEPQSGVFHSNTNSSINRTDTEYRIVNLQNYTNDTLNGISINTRYGVKTENYLNGKLDGECTYSSPKGLIERSIHYSKGVLSGDYSKYYTNGQLAYTITCKDGLPYTSVCAYSQDGKSLDAGTLKNGDGVLKCYYPNGRINSEDTYKNQCINGPETTYNDSGKIVEWGELYSVRDSSPLSQEYLIDSHFFSLYVARNMIFISGKGGYDYPDIGKETYETVHSDTSMYDKCFHKQQFYNNKLSSDFYLKRNLTFGAVKNYYENGQLEKTENYVLVKKDRVLQSLKDGLCKYYFKSGPIKAEVYFSDDKESGHSKYYDEAGNLVREHYVLKDGSEYNVFNGDTVNRINKNGHKQGKWISLGENYRSTEETEQDCNISPESIKYYKDGEPTGIWLFTTGDSIKLVWTDSIKAYSYRYDIYNDNNIPMLKSEGYVLDEHNKIGHWKEYNTDGKKSYLEWEGDYIYSRYNEDRGCMDGAWKHYKENGKIKEIITYKNGKQIDPKPIKEKKSKVKWEE